MDNVLHAASCLGGDLEYLHSRPHTLDTASSCRQVELASLGHIHLGDDRNVGAVEDGGILQWLVFALSGGEQDKVEFFAEIVAGRADEVADILAG